MGLSLFRAFLVINVFSIGTENPITPKPYRFSVYPVNKCPGSKTEFQRASQRMNCTKDLRYLCAPNKYLSSLIEFCTDRKRSLYGKGNCVVLEGEGDLDHYRCVEKFNRSCPSTPYYDEEIYKYPACLEIDKELRCFIAENGCNKREFLTTETSLNISKMETVGNETNLNISNMETFGNETSRGASHGLLAIGYIIAIAVVLTVIILIWIIFQIRKKEQVEKCKDNSENESLLKNNLEIDDDKLRQFLSKGEITVCHVRCIIVGCAKAGKTTLLKRLQNVSFDKLRPMERTEMVDFHVNSFEVLSEEETIQSVEKEDTVPTILFSKEKLEMPLKENDGKIAEAAHQPRIEKEDTVPTILSSKENLEMQRKENDGTMAEEAHRPPIRKKNVSEKSSLKNTTRGQIENIPMEKLNNDNAEDEENSKPHIQDTTLVQNQIFPEHGEDNDAIVDQNDFEHAILKIKDAVNELLNETDLRPRITFLDFAGQSMYYAFHQIFLRPKSCSILVMDITKNFDDEVGVQDGNEKECSQFASWKYSDYLKFWLRSIDVFSDTESPVIIVGTHADKVSNEVRNTFREKVLEFFNTWCHSDHQRHFNEERTYTIGFPVSGSEFEDLKGLKNCIAKIVKSPRYSNEKIRPVWALFEHILNIMKEQKKVISRKTLANYIDNLTAQEFRIDESEISKMLDFFHRVGVLLYFDKDGLKENIILDIQWLIDAIKRIIEYPVSTEKPDRKRRLFYQTGELDNAELERIWNVEGKDFLKHKTTIIAYMQQLGLLMPLKELHPTDSSGYYFPSMNSKRFDKTGEKHSKSSILCFKFDDKKQLPINFFNGIIWKCSKLNNWPISREEKKDNICLYQNAALFSFREHYVVLCNCNFEIRVQVWALPEIYDGRLLKQIKHSVEDIIHDDALSYEIGYKCRHVLNDEKDVSFNSQIIFPVSKYVCKTCDVDKNHVVENDICWESEVNYENQEHGERYKKKDENKSSLKDPEPPIEQNDDTQKSKTIQREEKQNQESVYKIAMIDGKRQHNPEIDDDILIQFLSKGNISVYHVRFIIVGCGKAGKTTLLKRLQNVSFDELMQIERTEMVDSHSFEVLLEEETIQSVGGKNLLVENSSQKKIENIPRDVPNNPANNNNAENERESICESQDKIFVQNQLYPNTNKTHDEDDKTHFQKYAISKIKDALNELLNEKKLRPRITFLDFPGQSMYYAFPQIFLRPESCPILVVDMTKSLNEKVDVKDKNEKECSQFTSWRYKDYYKFWLESIDTFVYSGSPVIIVGTHADKLSKEGCRKFLKSLNELFDNWSHSGLRRHLNEDRMYTIGFPDSGSELEDLKDLKKCIANIVKCPRYSKENIRPVWALFEHLLNTMKETEKVIPRKTLSDYNDQLSAQEFRIDESEISKMLVFFHRVGVLLYFDKDGLKEKIILDIQWLLDAFKCIIEYPVRTEVNDMKRRHFYRTGELDNVELDRIWHVEGKDFLKHKATIIAYMQQLGLLMPLKELHSIDSIVYYFPSMNSKRFDKTGENNSKSSIICFKFDDEMQLPINVFHGIVLKCSKLNNWSILTEGAKNNICLYQNAACFSFQNHVVVLCNCNSEIRVQVWASPEIYDGRLLKKIKHSVEDIIRDDDLSYEIGYKCRKDVLTDEEDVSFIPQSIFPVSNYVCKTCDVDENHFVKNDICWELEVNDENEEKKDVSEKANLPLQVKGVSVEKLN